MSHQEKQQRIESINKEMLAKLKELHKMLSSGGLTESVKTMEQYFQVGQPSVKTTPKKQKGKCQSVKGKISFTPELNRNHNHSHYKNPSAAITNQSRSVETIYKNAVEKRFSSSSDECVDISDENLDFFTSESLQLNDVPRDPHTPTAGLSYVNEQRETLGNQEYQSAG